MWLTLTNALRVIAYGDADVDTNAATRSRAVMHTGPSKLLKF